MEEIDFFERGGRARFYFFFKNLFWPTFLLPLWMQFKFWFVIKIFHTFLQALNGLFTLRYPTNWTCIFSKLIFFTLLHFPIIYHVSDNLSWCRVKKNFSWTSNFFFKFEKKNRFLYFPIVSTFMEEKLISWTCNLYIFS